MNHEEFEELAARHAIGETSEDDSRRMNEHVQSCERCRDDLVRHSEELASEDRGGGAFQTMMTRIPRRPFFRWWFGAAALFFLALYGWSELRLRAQQEELLQLQATFQQMVAENDRLSRRDHRIVDQRSMIASPATEMLSLRAPEGGAASGRLFFAYGSGYVVASGLTATARNAPYHVWIVSAAGGDPRAVGVLDVEPGGSGGATLHQLPAPSELKSVMVTLESSRAAVQPTGKPVLAWQTE